MRARDLLRRGAVLPLAAYRAVISPLKPASCIYSPSCSAYAQAAILRHGIFCGVLLGLARVGRCTAAFFRGGDDPVPEAFSFAAIASAHRRFRIRRGRLGPSEGETPG